MLPTTSPNFHQAPIDPAPWQQETTPSNSSQLHGYPPGDLPSTNYVGNQRVIPNRYRPPYPNHQVNTCINGLLN